MMGVQVSEVMIAALLITSCASSNTASSAITGTTGQPTTTAAVTSTTAPPWELEYAYRLKLYFAEVGRTPAEQAATCADLALVSDAELRAVMAKEKGPTIFTKLMTDWQLTPDVGMVNRGLDIQVEGTRRQCQ